MVSERLGDIDARGINSIPLTGTGDVVVRVGRYGPYLERARRTSGASVPEDLPPDELTAEKVEELFSAPSGERVLGADPATGRGRHGQGRPVRAVRVLGRADRRSLFASMSLDTVDPGRGAAAADAAAGARAPARTARRSPRRTGGTGRTSSRARSRARWSARTSSSR